MHARLFYIANMRNFVFVFLLVLLTACQTNTPEAVAPTEPLPTATPAATDAPPTPTLAPIVVEVTSESILPTATPEPIVEQETSVSLATSVTLQKVADGFNLPVYLTHAGDERLLVVEKHGVVSIISDGVRQADLFLDIEDRVNSRSNEQGLLGMAFHPDFRTNQRLFVYYTDGTNAVVISEFSAAEDLNSADSDSERILLTIPQPYRNHNGGALEFGPDGYLYIGLGDGGSANDPDYNGLDRSTLLGSILRIDVDSGDPYGIPADNPFVGDDVAKHEIWAYGIRNAWRISFDSATGDLFIGDVGQNEWEEVSWQPAASTGGENYGWNAWEGTHCFTNECDAFADATQPIIEYSHADGCSVTGGYVYRGSVSPSLVGNYVYGDFCSGNIWGAIPTGDGWQTALLANSGFFISSFGVDANNELYVLDYQGVVYRVSAE